MKVMLAFGFMLLYISYFGFVGYVASSWETTTSETVFELDSSDHTPNYDGWFENPLNPLDDRDFNFTTGYQAEYGVGRIWNNTTPIYINETWTVVYPATGIITDGIKMVRVELEDTETYLMNAIDYSFNIGAETNDVIITIQVCDIDGNFTTGGAGIADEDVLASYTLETKLAQTGYVNGTAPISLLQAIDINQLSSIAGNKAFITVSFRDLTGWTAHLITYDLQVNGTYQKGLSANTVIYWGAGIVGSMLWITGLLANEFIDLPISNKTRKKWGLM